MFKLIKAYQRWNFFERKWFWNNITITALGVFTLFVFDIILKNIIALIFFEAFLIYYNNIIYRSLIRQEREWKWIVHGISLDPITNKEVEYAPS